MRRIFYGFRIMFYVIRFSFRFFAGRPLLGDRKTDATFWTPATRSLDPSGTALRWEMMRGASRAAWRIAGAYLLLLSFSLVLLHFSSYLLTLPVYLRPSFLLLAHGALLALAGVSYLLRRQVREYGYSIWIPRRIEDEEGETALHLEKITVEGRREWLEHKVLPVSRSASMILGTSIPDRKALEWVTVPKDYRESSGKPVEIRLPSSFAGDEGVKKRLTSMVGQKLGIRSISASWQTEGASPRVLFSSPPLPPSLISFSDVERFLRVQGEWDFLYGVIGGGEAFSISVTGDTPHGAVSSGSGGGKSELLKGITAQAGHKGWFTIVLDWKEESQEWAKRLPGVRYLTTVESIHEMCIAIGDEIEWRKANPTAPRVRTLVLAEEWSITAPLLTEYWSALRSTADPEEKRTMPLRSPAITSIMKAIFAGRALGIFLQLVAIRLSARVTNGNADLRESFQVINMARYKPQTVKMLAPDVKPFPKKSTHPGRWVAVNGDEAVVYQGVLWSDEAATEWHQSGLPIPSSPFSEHCRPSSPSYDDMIATLGDPLGDRLAPPNGGGRRELPALEGEIVDRVDARKLSEMVETLEYLGITLNILQHAAKKDKTFPAVFGGSPTKGYTYDFSEVKEWARRRYASQKVSRG